MEKVHYNYKKLHELICVAVPAAFKDLNEAQSALQNGFYIDQKQYKKAQQSKKVIKEAWRISSIIQQREPIFDGEDLDCLVANLDLIEILLGESPKQCSAAYFGHCKHRKLFEFIAQAWNTAPSFAFDNLEVKSSTTAEIDIAARLAMKSSKEKAFT